MIQSYSAGVLSVVGSRHWIVNGFRHGTHSTCIVWAAKWREGWLISRLGGKVGQLLIPFCTFLFLYLHESRRVWQRNKSCSVVNIQTHN